MTGNEKFNQLLNSCTFPRAVHSALPCLSKTGILDGYRKERSQRAESRAESTPTGDI